MGQCCIVYFARGVMPCVVCLKVRLLTSKLANCNEVSRQRPHRAQITRASCLKNPGERNAVWHACANCVGHSLQFSVVGAHRWRYLVRTGGATPTVFL